MTNFIPNRILLIAILFASVCSPTLYGQGVMQPQPFIPYSGGSGAPGAWAPVHNSPGVGIPDAMMNDEHASRKLTDAPNYKTFTAPKKNLGAEAVAANKGYENNPDYGVVYPGAPCSNCYELIGERTEMSKTFVREGIHDGGKDKMTQTSTQPMHYRDANGNWVTIRTQLAPDAIKKGVYKITDEATPVEINTNAGDNFSALGHEGDGLKFNHNLELIYVQPDGKEVSLGAADYTHHTAGDGGVYVTDAWPGIDIEMNVLRAAIKTNFHLNHALPQYAAGKLLIRDHLQLGKDQSLNVISGTRTTRELEIDDNAGVPKYGIAGATVYEQNDRENTLKALEYYVGDNNLLDIVLPGAYLNKAATSYPVVIDPLVTVATTSAVGGSTYIAALTATSGCEYTNAANTPANCTVTDIQFQFQYTCNSPMGLEYGGTFFYLGTCRSPGTLAAGFIWSCNSVLPGTCTATGGTTYSIWGTGVGANAGLGPCVPAPQCAAYALNIKMYFMQTWENTAACATTWCYASQPLIITVLGHTVELTAAGVTATPVTICAGSSSTLTASGLYGVPPYTYAWTPGPLAGSPVVVSPLTTTTYDLTVTDACGITTTGSVTVNVNVEDPITGTTTLCVGNTTTLADAEGGGHTWVSSNTGVATITSPGGVVTAVGAGTTTITYTTTASGCYATAVITVDPTPAAITGTETVCVGGTTQLLDAVTGVGFGWSSSNVTVATVNGTGLVTGVNAGTATITYGSAACYVTAIVTVNLLSPITGTLKVCQGSTTTLADAAGAGTWLSGTTGVATVGATTGVVTGVSGGTSIITFTTAGGCSATAIVTVNPVSPITGTMILCVGSTSTLADAVGGGTWSSGTVAVATIGLTTGVVNALSNGTTTIVYTTPAGCTATAIVTVNALSAITGMLTVCQGSTTTLADAAGGGTWSSGTLGVATVGLTTGVVTGVAGGTSTIVYTTAAGCTISAVVTVNPLAPITGTMILCVGSTSTLADAVGGGTWSSGTVAVATIGLTTGVVNALSNGTTTIVYTTPAGCTTTAIVTVNALSAITGTLTVCQGSTTTLADAAGGGTWSSGTLGVATIGLTTGVVTGVGGGTSTIVYTTAAGCTTSAVVTVNPLAPITGTLALCAGSTSTLADAVGGGTWSSGTVGVATIGLTTGVVNAISNGTTTIVYTTPAGCTTTAVVTVNALSAITGTMTVCQGSTTTLADAAGGGTWSSGTPGVATIGLTTGVVTGVAGGTSTIVYTTGAGCTVSAVVTVNPLAPITGTLTVCVGLTTTLADAVGGGTWSSGTVGVATIGLTTGIVTGVSNGTSNIVYTTPAGCTTSAIVTVNPISAITGTLKVCQGSTTTLADAAGGGTWNSGTTGVATIGVGTGVVTGVAGGTSTIVYTTAAGCTASAVVTVNPLAPITGTLALCAGSSTTLSDAVGGGTWNSSTVGVATIGLTTGVVNAIANGTTTIMYTTPAGCTTTAIVTVNALSAITGTLHVCVGSTTTLGDAVAGGTWASGTTGVATVGLTTGIVTGIASGTSTIVYTTAAGCNISAIVTVNPVAPITGNLSICTGTSTTLADALAGGTWSSTVPGVATIGLTSGVVNGLTAGISTISYLLPTGCVSTTIVTINTVAAITGTASVCVGSTTTLNDATPGGTWSSSAIAVATINAAGTVTGVSGGTATIIYTSPAGCTTSVSVVVNPSPAAISGLTNVCAGLTISLSDITPGGVWSSSNAAIAGVSATGIVTGASAGAATITYKLAGGCYVTLPIVVNPLPVAITGGGNVCLGLSINLNDGSGGGAWSSSNPGVAAIGATTGIATGIAAGAVTITYTLPTGCITTTPVTVVPLPGAPVTSGVDYCQGAPAVPLTATGVNLMWYTSSTGGTGTATAPTPLTTTPGITTWWVSQNVNGCEGPRAPLQVNVHILPVNNIVPSRPTTCQYDTIGFTNAGPTFPGETYKWWLPSNGVLYAGSSLTAQSIIMEFDTVFPTNYVVLTVGDGYAPCNVTDSFPITVYVNSPIATFYLKPNICVGDSVTIALTSIGPGVTDYTWNFGSATIITASSNHGGPFLATWATAGIYTVELTAISNLNCPSNPILDTVEVHALPNATFTYKPKSTNTLCIEDSVLFIANDTAYNNSYLWQPAHGFNNDNKPVIWGKVEETQSDITLTVTDPFGCSSTSMQQLDASTCCTVLFPNAFTPNGDGKNDVFRPLFNGYHNFHFFRIANRWGQTIFESENSLPSWDGTFNGVAQDIGTYFYYIQYDCGGNTIEAKGDVTLIR